MTTDVQRLSWREHLPDSRVHDAVLELCRLIQQTFPEAEFHIYSNPEHRGAIVEVYTDSTHADDVFDLVDDRRVDLLVDEDISIRIQPLHRAWLRPVDR